AVEFGLELAAEQHARPVFAHVAPAVDVLATGGFGLAASQPHELTDYDRGPARESADARGRAGHRCGDADAPRRHRRRARRLRGHDRRRPDRRRLPRPRLVCERGARQRLPRRAARGTAPSARRPRHREHGSILRKARSRWTWLLSQRTVWPWGRSGPLDHPHRVMLLSRGAWIVEP